MSVTTSDEFNKVLEIQQSKSKSFSSETKTTTDLKLEPCSFRFNCRLGSFQSREQYSGSYQSRSEPDCRPSLDLSVQSRIWRIQAEDI